MSFVFYTELARIRFKVECRFDLSSFFGSFLCAPGENAVPIVSPYVSGAGDISWIGEDVPPREAELLAVHREIAEALPRFDAAFCHGVALAHKGRGYFITGKSGAGKSTHSRLWKKYLGDLAVIINGDKPIMRREDDGIYLYSSPWAGKEGWLADESALLCGVCFIKQAKQNAIANIAERAATRLIGQIYISQNGEKALNTISLLDHIASRLPVYELECDVSEDAFALAYRTLTKENR